MPNDDDVCVPRARWLWLPILVVASCISPVMHFGGGKSRTRAEHDTLVSISPGRLSMEKRWSGPVMDAKIRVYADDEYRAQNRKWRESFDERLDYANAVLAASFGVRLVADYREWDHHAPGAALAEHLEQLERLDDGRDVLAVVGLTSSVGLVSATFEQLGIATVSGRHMILRGYADLEERKAFADAFADLSADERESALVTMRFHKTTSVFLHELGHNLGAGHDTDDGTIMSGTYSRDATTFSAVSRATIQRVLDERLGRGAPSPIRKVHAKVRVVVVENGVLVDGVRHDDGEMNMLFRIQASLDAEAEVVFSSRGDVVPASVTNLMAIARAMGLTNVRLE